MNFIEYWKEFLVFAGLISTYIAGRESTKIKNKTDSAIAEQEVLVSNRVTSFIFGAGFYR